MSIKPSIFDNLKVTSDAQKIELLSIENLSQKEYCETPEDIKNSEIVKKILSIINRKANYVLDFKPKNSNLNDIYEKFTKNLPLTLKQVKYFKDFLSEDYLIDEIQKIISKLLILKGENNSNFIDSFLTNGEGKFMIDNFINYLSVQIENYKLIVDIDDESSIKLLSKEKEGDYYTYNSNGKTGIFIVSNGEIFMLKKLFEEINLLNNGLIFCRIENKDLDTSELGNNGLSGLLYDFDGNDFVLMEKMPLTIQIQNTQKEDLFITSVNLIGYGLSEINKWDITQNKLGVEINELLGPVYNNIRFQGNFVIANKPNRENKDIYEIYIIIDNQLELVHKTESNSTIGLRDLGDNYYLVDDDNGKSLYKLNKYNIFDNIDDRLLGIKNRNIESLMKGEPTLIYNENGTGIYIFDKVTGKLKQIIDAGNISIISIDINGDMLIISTENGKKVFFYKDGKLYNFRKGSVGVSIAINGVSIKKGFFSKQIFIKNEFEAAKDYLDETTSPFKLNTK